MGTRELFFLLLVIVCWGATPLIEKTALARTEPLDGLYIRSLVVFVLFTLYYAFSGRFSRLSAVPVKDAVLFTASGLLAGFLGMLFYYHILRANAVSRTVPLSAVYPLFTALLAVLFLGENVTWQRFLGTILIVFGILLVK